MTLPSALAPVETAADRRRHAQVCDSEAPRAKAAAPPQPAAELSDSRGKGWQGGLGTADSSGEWAALAQLVAAAPPGGASALALASRTAAPTPVSRAPAQAATPAESPVVVQHATASPFVEPAALAARLVQAPPPLQQAPSVPVGLGETLSHQDLVAALWGARLRGEVALTPSLSHTSRSASFSSDNSWEMVNEPLR